MSIASLGSLPIGPIPRVVGTVTDLELLRAFVSRTESAECDIVELRLDLMPSLDGLFELAEKLGATNQPTFGTVRFAQEGGHWSGSEPERLQLLEKALTHTSGVDIELVSNIAEPVCQLAKAQRKACIVSYHDFEKTPNRDLLASLVERAQNLGTIAKISTMVKSRDDIESLRSLLTMKWDIPLCVIGMGALGTETRLQFPLEGSCLTYGYLDKLTAPGQVSARALKAHLRASLEKP